MRDVRRRDGGRDQRKDVTAQVAGALAPVVPDGRLTSAELGRSLGQRATLVQFSSAFCAPCRATRQILADVAGMVDGVEYIEVDAEARLDLVRRLNVLRTPTVLVTDASGLIVKRASGQPRRPDVIAAIGQAVGVGNPINLIGNEDSDSDARRA
jgi:thiol-disulfide isomerase/thioredoxin